MVTTSGGALEEVVGHAGLLVAPGDAVATAAAIEAVLDDPDLRARLAARGPERVATMGWSHTAAEHAEIYRELAGR